MCLVSGSILMSFFIRGTRQIFFFFFGNFGDFRKILNTLNVCSVKGVG